MGGGYTTVGQDNLWTFHYDLTFHNFKERVLNCEEKLLFLMPALPLTGYVTLGKT